MAGLTNEMKYWESGRPYGGVEDGTNTNGEMKYWDSGFPFQFIFPPSSSSLIKTVNGLAIASVKTWNGLARASVKTINGLA